MAKGLGGRTVTLPVAPEGTEDAGFSEPKRAAGAAVHVISAEAVR